MRRTSRTEGPFTALGLLTFCLFPVPARAAEPPAPVVKAPPAPAVKEPPAVQEPPAPVESKDVVDEVIEHVDLYGRAAGHFGTSTQGMAFQNASSRLGVRGEMTVHDFVGFAQYEWNVNLGSSDDKMNLDQQGGTGFATITTTENAPALRTRLALVGLKLRNYGTVVVGKQWGVYYDVTGLTDIYMVYGGRASMTYDGSGDGGVTGTGRANDAVSYRASWGPLRVGLMGQVFPDNAGAHGGVSGMVGLQWPGRFFIGTTFAHTELDRSQFGTAHVAGYDGGSADAWALGTHLHEGPFDLRAVVAASRNQQLVTVGDEVGTFPGAGLETLASYRVKAPQGELVFSFGNNILWPTTRPTELIDPGFRTVGWLANVQWFAVPALRVYAETLLSGGHNADGSTTPYNFAIGLRYEFSSNRALADEFRVRGAK